MTNQAVEVGKPAPGWIMPASGGRTITTSSLLGKPYLIYFYPKADTSGCTAQACGIQEALPALGELGLAVVGVSPDPVKALDKFAAKYGLTFPLASDPAHEVADLFGCWIKKSMYGREYMGMERSSFLVDREDVVQNIWRKVKPAKHAKQVEAAAQIL